MADISPELRIMLIEFRRARITEANAIAALLALDVVRTEAEWRRRDGQEVPVRPPPPPPPPPVKTGAGWSGLRKP